MQLATVVILAIGFVSGACLGAIAVGLLTGGR